MTTEFEQLITAGYKAVDNAELALQEAMAQIYRDAYEQAANELAKLFARAEGEELTLALARRKDQLGGLLRSISEEYKKITGEAITLTGENLELNFTESAKAFLYALDQATDAAGGMMVDMGAAWYAIPAEAVRASVMSEFSGLTYIKTFQKNMQGQLWQVQSIITRGIATGATYDKIASELKKLFNKGFSDAMRVVRTEAGRSYTEGFLYQYEKGRAAGIRMNKQWVATLDTRTRDSHGHADGQFADSEGMFHVGGAKGPGPHLLDSVGENINCRCRTIAALEQFPQELRRDPTTGDLKKYFTFEQWKKEHYA